MLAARWAPGFPVLGSRVSAQRSRLWRFRRIDTFTYNVFFFHNCMPRDFAKRRRRCTCNFETAIPRSAQRLQRPKAIASGAKARASF
eukprot:3673186-Pyramimonas_sp.AAC.1